MSKRINYHERVYKEVVNATADYIYAKEVPNNRVLYVTHAVIENQNHAPTTLAFGKRMDDNFVVMEEEGSPSLGISYHTVNTHHFIEDERPCFRVEGATVGDKIMGYLEGYYEVV